MVPTVTWTVKNIPLQYNIEQVVEEFDKADFTSLYDSVHLPIACNTKKSKAYAFVFLVGSNAGESLLGILMGSASAPTSQCKDSVPLPQNTCGTRRA